MRPTVVIHGPIRIMPWSYDVERQLLDEAGADLIVPPDQAAAVQR